MEILTSASEAWAALGSCGLEVHGRDADLTEMLRQNLDEKAATLEEALAGSSIADFVRSFFSVAGPFVDMLKDLLRFFEHATAKVGPTQWQLAFDDYEVHVEAFKNWLKTIEKLGMHIESPALSWREGWKIVEALRSSEIVEWAFKAGFQDLLDEAAFKVKDWLDHYRAGTYSALPNTIAPGAYDPQWLKDIWSCLLRAMSQLERVGHSRKRCHAYSKSVGWRITEKDAFALDSICQSETDFWLRGFVIAYAVVVNSERARIQAQEAVEQVLVDIPRSTYFVEVGIEDVKTFISLPMWKKRYEFFAAWVAAEMILSLEEHEIQIHHEDGKITLPFRETMVATVTSTSPPVELIAERRTGLIGPVGKGRSTGVQPDYGWWRKLSESGRCDLVVEVKHYKKASPRSWKAVFEDYARAHPYAKVLLVNYGPPGDDLKSIPNAFRDQCEVIGELQPARVDTRLRLSNAVRTAVGKPLPKWPSDDLRRTKPQTSIIALDVSPSMPNSQSGLRRILALVANEEGVYYLAGIDTQVRGEWPAHEDGFEALMGLDRSGGTELTAPLGNLLKRYSIVIVITDQDGKRLLDSRGDAEQLIRYSNGPIYVYRVSSSPDYL